MTVDDRTTATMFGARRCTKEDCQRPAETFMGSRCRLHEILRSLRFLDVGDFAEFQRLLPAVEPYSDAERAEREQKVRLRMIREDAGRNWRYRRLALDAGISEDLINAAIDKGMAEAAMQEAKHATTQ